MARKTKAAGPTRAAGQYVRYGAAVVQMVCEDLATGKTWEQVAALPGRPSYHAMYNWRKTHPEFAAAADAARAFGADHCADQALEVAEQATEETVRKAKLHVDTLMQRAALLAPERWSGRGGGRAAERAEPLEVVFSFRHFENVIGPDGKTVVREIKPEGEA